RNRPYLFLSGGAEGTPDGGRYRCADKRAADRELPPAASRDRPAPGKDQLGGDLGREKITNERRVNALGCYGKALACLERKPIHYIPDARWLSPLLSTPSNLSSILLTGPEDWSFGSCLFCSARTLSAAVRRRAKILATCSSAIRSSLSDV